MTLPVSPRSVGGEDIQYCEICGGVAGAATTLRRIGLTGCASCGVHACPRCWARSPDGCPGCGLPALNAAASPAPRPATPWARQPRVDAAAAPGASSAVRSGSPRRRPHRARVLAAALAVAAVAVLAVVLARPLQLTGEVAGIAGTPGPGATRDGPTAAADEPPDPTGPDGAMATRSAATAPPPTTRPASPTSTVVPTPLRTDQPTPRPTLRPTPTPTPAGCVAIAPDLIGQPRSSAARLWRAAGLTGSVRTLPGRGNYEIATQDPTPGTRLDCEASVTVGP